VEQVLGSIATSAHGNLTRAELLAAGMTPAEIRSRLHSGALTIEYDGVYHHGSRHAWEQDREREARARGDEFRRYTFEDVERPGLMLARLRRLLQRPA
jgi:hypothetical protein